MQNLHKLNFLQLLQPTQFFIPLKCLRRFYSLTLNCANMTPAELSQQCCDNFMFWKHYYRPNHLLTTPFYLFRNLLYILKLAFGSNKRGFVAVDNHNIIKAPKRHLFFLYIYFVYFYTFSLHFTDY